MSDEIVKQEESPPVPTMTEEAFNQIAQAGDFSRLSTTERSIFLWKFAEQMGVNPLTKPFNLIPIDGKLTLYATKGCADQLAMKHKLSTAIEEEILDEDRQTFTVKVKVSDQSGREDFNIGSVGVAELRGEGMANARMKAYTKAKRRAILSFLGFGFLDELEIESIRGASEEAIARRGMSTTLPPTKGTPNHVVQVVPPESPAPKIEASEPGQPLPPTQPPTEVK
jgi:hypothetical protein